MFDNTGERMKEQEPQEEISLRRVAIASMSGTVLEWYDFFLYGFAAVLVFGDLFFPTFSPLAGTLASLGTFVVGFVARPIGGVVFGHFGDRIGRKSMLILTIGIMGGGSFAIGLLPTYEHIGVVAPILLVVLRFFQGIGLGGEWGGAVLMTVEYAAPSRRGFWGSIVQLGAPAGQALAVLILFGGSFVLSDQAFLSWGWRIPFLLSAALLVLGLYIRLKIVETPAFRKIKEQNAQVRLPIVEVLRNHRTAVLTTILVYLGGITVPFYITWIFLVSYATETLQVDRTAVLLGVVLANVILVPATLAGGYLSDRVGRRPVCMWALLLVALLAFPVFWIANLSEVGWVWLAMLLFGFPTWFIWGALPAFFSELFPTQIRYSGMSVGAQTGTIIGSLTPFFAAAVVPVMGTWPVSLVAIAVGVGPALVMYFSRETLGSDLGHDSAPTRRLSSSHAEPLMNET
ncbi:MFS transporter [Rhodococcus opacus]|uniref:MFS transporter n=1 Tax=Rhodococcus opacus TaxID=37919 RepID=UPI00294A3E03|nr:MFS transporter [Rhodococcus opacus]MDV6247076.1 MFS transporter [Rhodococcus opacus]